VRFQGARTAAIFLFAAGFFLAARPARAQVAGTGGTIGTVGTLGTDDFFIGVQGTQNVNLTTYDLLTYFNQANCECERPTYVFAALSTSGVAKRPLITTGSYQVWVGVSCDQQPPFRESQCDLLGSGTLPAFAAAGGQTFPTTAKVLSQIHGNGTVPTIDADGGIITVGTGGTTVSNDPCVQSEQLTVQTIFLLVDQTGTGTFTLGTSLQIPLDLSPPPAPDPVSARGGNEAVVVNWTSVPATSDTSGILGYQIFCDRAGQFQVFDTGDYKPNFETPTTNCPDKFPAGQSVASLDPAFLCSDLLSAAATSARVKILQNDIWYRVSVVTIDKHKNPSLTEPDVFGKPLESDDFYSKYRNSDPSMPGGNMQPGSDAGGYCAVPPGSSSGRGWMAFPALGVASAAVLLAARRRRRRP
jgi:hypothetical protein